MLKPRLSDRSWTGPCPADRGSWAGKVVFPEAVPPLEGLDRDHHTVNLERTFILCAGLVGPWPWVSGN